MPFMEAASFWSLLGLSSLLLVPLLILLLCPRCRILLVAYEQIFRIFSKLQFLNEAAADNKAYEKEANKVAVAETKYMESPKNNNNNGGLVGKRAGLRQPNLHGMDVYEIKVLEFLEDGASSLLGISGMHGVGKSTLLMLVRDNFGPGIHFFQHVLYLQVGNGCTVGMLQAILARRMGLLRGQPPHMSNNVPLVASFISSGLKDKTFLLLLDDVRDDGIDLSAVDLPMPLGHRQKVVFTTRDKAICAKMGCPGPVSSIEMQCLGEDVAWDLFRYCAGDKLINSNPAIKGIAKKIAAECRGFPSALCLVGRSMSIQTELCQWRLAYDMLLKIKRTLPTDIKEMSDKGYPCLQYFKGEFADLFLS